MKILIFHPFRNQNQDDFCIMSIGMITTANLLIKAGHDVIGINLPLQYSIGECSSVSFFLEKYKPDVVIISFHWYEFIGGTLQLAVEIKKYCSSMRIMVAGMSATFFANYLQETRLFEQVLVDGIDYVAIINGNEKILICERKYYEDFNNENFTNIEFLLNHTKYYKAGILGYDEMNIRNFWLCLARGCKYNCSYCGGSKKAHKLYYNRSQFCVVPWEKVIISLDELEKKQVEQISFTHDLELLPYSKELVAECICRNFNIYYESFQLPSVDFLEYIVSNGKNNCHIAITAISGNEKNRKKEGKYFTNDDLIKIISEFSDIKFDIYFTLNVYNETVSEYMETIQLAKKLKRYGQINLFCMPYFQNEIGSQRWIDSKLSMAESVQLLLGYVSISNKTEYFLKQDVNNVTKILLWNQMISESNCDV